MTDFPTQGLAEGPEFACPFCGAACVAFSSPDDSVPPGVMHELPVCKMFVQMSPINFLKAANEAERRKN